MKPGVDHEHTSGSFGSAGHAVAPADKSHLLELLIASLDKDEEYEKAWEAVADEREADIAAGRAQWVPGDEAMLRLRARLVR
jgi:hypothetical protein